MPIGKFNTSVLEQEAKTFNTSILADDVDMTPEDTARAQIQFEEEKPDFSPFRVVGKNWGLLKQSAGDIMRAVSLDLEKLNPWPEYARPEYMLHTSVERMNVRSEVARMMSEGMDGELAHKTAIANEIKNRRDDSYAILDAMEKSPEKKDAFGVMLRRVADSRALQLDPEYERSSGLIEDVLTMPGQMALSLGANIVLPGSGLPVMYEQIKGNTYQRLAEDVGDERAYRLASFNAIAQTPLEFLGEMFIIKKMLAGGRPWAKLVADIARSAGVEGLTEFAQQYPDELVTFWAANPDVSLEESARHLMSGEVLKNAAYAGLVGALSGGLLTGAGHGAKRALDRYVLEPQRKKNEERADLVLGAVKKLKEGAALSTQEQDALGGLGLPQAFVDRMYYQTPVDTENRDKVYDGLLKSNITKEQADTYMTIFDAIAHHYAEVTGQTPEAFYDVELVDYRVGKFDEFNVDQDRAAAQTKTQFHEEDLDKHTQYTIIKEDENTVSEPNGERGPVRGSRRVPSAVQQTLSIFGPEGKEAESKTEERPIKAELKARVDRVQVGSFRTRHSKINSPETVASVLLPIGVEAQENMMALVVDSNDAPLAVIRHSIGLPGSTQVDPSTLLGASIDVPGAKKIWFSHNHPSGSAMKSGQDATLMMNIEGLLRGSGIESMGMVIIASNAEASYFNGEVEREVRPADIAEGGGEIPSYGRIIKQISNEPAFTSPAEGRDYLKALSGDGILLVSNTNAPVAWIPMTVDQMNLLRTNDTESGSSLLYRAIHRSNGRAAIIKMESSDNFNEAKNIIRFIKESSLNVVDVFYGNDLANSAIEQNINLLSVAGTFYQLADNGVPNQFISEVSVAGERFKKVDVPTDSVIDRRAKIVSMLTELNAGNLFDPKDVPFKEALEEGKAFYDLLRSRLLECPAFEDKEVRFGDTGWEHLTTSTSERKLSEKNIARRLSLLDKAVAIIENAAFVEDVRPEGKVATFGLIGRFEDGSVVSVALQKESRNGKEFLTVYDLEDVSRKLRRAPAPNSSSTDIAGSGVGAAPSGHDNNIIGTDGGKVKFQISSSASPLGATVFTSSGAIIHAFEGNNISTPIHEVGHVLVDLISRYDPESFSALCKYLGKDPAKGIGAWITADHEKLAKAFETYMMQGKAPSFRLVHAFKQMRTWLLELYRRVTKLGAKVTPEIRSVFDKWLTTEDEKLLDEMSDITNLMDEQSPYYAELKKLKTEAIKEYAELAAKAQAIVDDKDRKKRIIELKHLRAQLRKQAEEIIDGTPYYQDIKTLREEGRFSEDIIRRMRNYGEDHLQVFREKGVMAKNGKLSPDAFVHELVYSYGRGYDTPEEFLDLVLEMPTRKDAIEQKYEDLLSDFNESVEAEGLVFDDAEAVIDAEIQLLYAMLGKSPVRSKILSREIKKREELTEDDVRDLKKVAADLERTAREAFDQGAKEERGIQEEAAAEIQGKQKADIAALKEKQKEKLGELKQKNLEKVIALKEKQKEVIRKLREQNRIGQEKKKIMARMKKHIKRLGMIYENRQQLQALLARYFKVGKYTPDDTLPTLQGFFEAKIDPETQAGEVIQGILEDLPDPRRDASGEVIARNKSGGAKGSPWALADLETIAQVADMIVALDASERSNTTEVVKQERANLVDHIYAMADMKPSFLPDGQIKVRQAESWMDRVKESGADLYASLRRIEFFCNFLDGFEKTGLAWARIFKPTADAENHELKLHEAYDTKIAAIMNQFVSDDAWFRQEHEFYGMGGMKNKLSRQNAFMVALNSGNEHNLNYLREGNRVPQQTIDYIWDEFLTEQEKKAVHEIWDLFDSLYPMLNDINKAILGAPLKKVEGHYFPIKTDYKDPERGHIARKREDEQLARDTGFGPHSFAYPEHGFRKERAEGMKEFPSLLLEASVITTHLDRTIHDISHTLPLLEVYRLIRDPEVMKAIKDVAGENMYDQLTPWLRSISRPVSEPLAWQERVSRHLRKNTSIVGMGLKMSVAALQPLDLFSTWHELGLKATARGIGKFFGGGFLRTAKAIDDASIMMRYRSQAYDREVADFKRKLLDRGGTWRSLHDYYFAFCRAMDDLVAYPTWQAAFDEASQKYLLPDGSIDEEKVIDFADSTVRRVLGAGRAKDLPNAMKGSEMKRFWTMFYTWANKFENQMMELQAKTGRQGLTDPKTIAELMKAALLLVVIPAYLSMFLYKRRLPEDEEWATWLLAYRCQGIPIVRDLAGFMSGYDMRMPLSDAYKSLVSVGKDFGKVKGWVVDDEDLDAYKIAKHVGTAAGYVFGLPTAQAFVTIDGALDLMQGKSDNPMDLLFRAPRESKKKEEAYY